MRGLRLGLCVKSVRNNTGTAGSGPRMHVQPVNVGYVSCYGRDGALGGGGGDWSMRPVRLAVIKFIIPDSSSTESMKMGH